MHYLKTEAGTGFNFNSDFSGEITIQEGKERGLVVEVPFDCIRAIVAEELQRRHDSMLEDGHASFSLFNAIQVVTGGRVSKHKTMIFSQRKQLAIVAENWCRENNAEVCALNIVAALDRIGAISGVGNLTG